MSIKILVVPQAFTSKERPNITPFIRVHTKALLDRGYDVSVLNVDMLPFRKWIHKHSIVSSLYEVDKIPVYYYAMQSLHKAQVINTFHYQIKLNKLFQLYKKNKGVPDIIVAHFSQYSGYCASKIAIKNNIPIISIEHAGWLLEDRINPYELKKLRFVVDHANKFICVSDKLKTAISQKTKTSNSIYVIPNMISDIFRFKPLKKSDTFIFFSAGNLYPVKRMDMLVTAFCKAFKDNKNVVLRIAGSGIEQEKLEDIIRNNGMQDRIYLLGSLKQEEMLVEYENCNAFVLVSKHETFGIVYREAMAVGRPIITTNHQGFIGDLWEDFYGIKIEIDNEEELIDALTGFLDNYNSFDLKQISNSTINRFSANKVMDEYDKCILELV